MCTNLAAAICKQFIAYSPHKVWSSWSYVLDLHCKSFS